MSGCLHTGLRGFILSGRSQEKADAHPLTSQPAEEEACSTPLPVSMVTKRVGRWLRASELVGVHSILREVLLVKL